jgi:hypothetical protein
MSRGRSPIRIQRKSERTRGRIRLPGHSERTPAIALTAFFLVISCVIGFVAALGLLLYYCA